MRTVRIEKEKLRETVQKNRDNHRDIFLKAQEGYCKAVIRELDEMLERARKGDRIRVNIGLAAPQDYTEQYDRVLLQLEYTEDDVIELTDGEFQNYIQDEWGWTGAFQQTSAGYIGENDSIS